MLGTDDYSQSLGIEGDVNSIGKLLRESFLELGASRQYVQRSCQLAGAYHSFTRNIADVCFTKEWQEMVLARRVEQDVFDDDHFLVCLVKSSSKYLNRIFIQP